MYVTPTLAGSRSGALAVCAWASMVSIGKQGYQARVKDIVEAARKIATGIQDIKGLQLLTAQPVFMVVSFASDDDESFDIYRVSDAMKDKGWSLNSLQAPASVHVCVTLQMVPKVSLFLDDLRDAVRKARVEGKEGCTKGSAGIYGTGKDGTFTQSCAESFTNVSHLSSFFVTTRHFLVGKLPDGPVECVLQVFTDMTLTP
jgi:sphinganine-1-phosphate aldolase